jgi:hypothetical protein
LAGQADRVAQRSGGYWSIVDAVAASCKISVSGVGPAVRRLSPDVRSADSLAYRWGLKDGEASLRLAPVNDALLPDVEGDAAADGAC